METRCSRCRVSISDKWHRYCADCRKIVRDKKQYPLACSECHKHKKTDKNGVCKKCNANVFEIKECSFCGEILPISVFFYKGKKKCKSCFGGGG